MSGDIQVRKRKGKNKKKELGTESERPAQGSKLQNETSPFVESSSKYSDESNFEQTEDYSDMSARNGSKKRRQESPSKSSASSGSGCCAKILFVFLVTFLVILAALIFIQLHSSEYSSLVKESHDSSVRPVENSHPPEDSLASNTHAKRALDIEDIEKQILREGEAEKTSFLGVSPRAVDVEIPNDDPDRKTPVQEPPIVKETAHVLGNERVDSDAIQANVNSDESKPIDDNSGVESSADNEGNTDEIYLKNDDSTKETVVSQSKNMLEKPDDNIKPKRKNRKGSRKAPPSPEEILAHQNTLDRAEMLMSAIGELSPNHPLLEELRPHLDGATRDLKNYKLEGLESTSKHALIILEDLYVRLADAKEKGELTTDHSRFFEEESQLQAGVVESVEKTSSDTAPSSPITLQPSDSSIQTSDSSNEVSASAIGSSDTALPASDSAAPASESAPPASKSAPPASKSAPPASESAPPASESAPPASESAPPASESALPASESALPASESAPPASESAPPASESAPPASVSTPPASESAPPASESAPPASESAPPASESAPPASDSTASPPRTSVSAKNSGAAASKESAPRELSASHGDIGLEDLTEADLASPIDSGDQLLKLREAEALREQDPRTALREFTAVVREQPLSARAQLGRARCLDTLALAERSNARLEQAIASFRSVLDIAEEQPELVSQRLLRASTNTLIDKLRFRGHLPDCARAQLRLLDIFPDDAGLRNQLGITYLLQGKPAAAQEVFAEVLRRWPHDGLAQVHLGFILKTTDDNNAEGARLMKDGIASGDPGTGDARFYFHLGDALHRMGRQQEAHQVYEEAASKELILRPAQRSLYNVNRLSAKPVWSPEETTYGAFFKKLELNWETIRNEGLALIAAGYQPEAENLRDKGKWGQLELYSRGRQNISNCARAPRTCSIVRNFKPASGCRRGQVKFSLMEGGTHVWAHCGPTNCRLRAHLGLVIPTDPAPVLRVADQYLSWKEGEIFVFDDSFEHEVWHNGTEPRLVLIVDLWHPELTKEERATLAPV